VLVTSSCRLRADRSSIFFAIGASLHPETSSELLPSSEEPASRPRSYLSSRIERTRTRLERRASAMMFGFRSDQEATLSENAWIPKISIEAIDEVDGNTRSISPSRTSSPSRIGSTIERETIVQRGRSFAENDKPRTSERSSLRVPRVIASPDRVEDTGPLIAR